MSDPRFAIGGNTPPADAELADLRERLARDHKSLVGRFYDLELGMREIPVEIIDDIIAGRVTDFIGQAQGHIAKAKVEHTREKKPFLEGGKIVDEFFLRRNEKLALAISPAVLRLDKYRKAKEAEERRLQAEERRRAEADRQRAEAEAAARQREAERLAKEKDRAGAAVAFEAAAAAEREAQRAQAVVDAPPVRTRVMGEYGSTAYSKNEWKFEIEDVTVVPLGFLSPDPRLIQAALDDALSEARAKGREEPEIAIAGVRFYQDEKLIVRRGGAR